MVTTSHLVQSHASSANSSARNAMVSSAGYWTSSGRTGEHWLEIELPSGRTLAKLDFTGEKHASYSKHFRIRVKSKQ